VPLKVNISEILFRDSSQKFSFIRCLSSLPLVSPYRAVRVHMRARVFFPYLSDARIFMTKGQPINVR